MHIKSDIHERDLGHVVDSFVELVEWDTLAKHTECLLSRIEKNPLLQDLFYTRHEIEISGYQLKRRLRLGRKLSMEDVRQNQKFFNFAGACRSMLQVSPASVSTRLKQQLTKSLDQTLGFLPLAVELSAGVHFSRLGWDVEFPDLTSGDGSDLLIAQGKKMIEIECKCLSADSGRKIHQHHLIQLAAALLPAVQRYARLNEASSLARVQFRTRPALDTASLKRLVEAFSDCLHGGSDASTREFTITLADLPKGVDVGHNTLVHRSNGGELCVQFRCDEPDKVGSTLLKRLKNDTKRQFSQSHPALMLVNILGIADEDIRRAKLLETGKDTGFQHIATALLNRRPHLIGLAFTGTVSFVPFDGNFNVHSSSGLSYNFFNHNCERNTEGIKREELFPYVR